MPGKSSKHGRRAAGPEIGPDVVARLVGILRPGALGLTVFIVAARPMLGQSYDLDAFTFGLILLAAVMWFTSMLIDGEMRYRLTGIELPALGLLLLAAASNFWAHHLQSSLVYTLNFLGCLLIFVLTANLPANKGQLVARALVATAVVVAAYGIHQRLFGFDQMLEELEQNRPQALHTMNLPLERLDDAISRVKSLQVFGTFANPNSLGGFLILALPAGFTALIALRRWRLAGLIVLLPAGALCLFWTASKGSWASAAGGLALLAGTIAVGKLARGRLRWLPFAAICIVLAWSTCFMSPEKWRSVGGESMQVRAEYAFAARSMIAERPAFGVGAHNFPEHYPLHKAAFAREVRDAHNSWLQVVAELGLAGGVLLLALAAAAVRFCLAPAVDDGETSEPGILLQVLAGAAVIGMALTLGSAFGIEAEPAVKALSYLFAAVLWVVAFKLLAGVPMRTWRLGCILGVAFFTIHCFVDYDWYVPGLAMIFWALLGCVAATSASSRVITWRPRPKVLTALSVVAILATLAYIVPAIGPMHRAMTAATWKEVAWGLQSPEHDRAAPVQSVLDAYGKSIAANPLDDQAFYRAGRYYEKLFNARVNRSSTFTHAIWCYERASQLDPLQSSYYSR